METKKKAHRNLYAYIIVITVFITAVLLTSCGQKETFDEWVKRAWNVDLPKNMTEIFFKSDRGLAGGGDGVDYNVVTAKDEPTDFLEGFSRERNGAFENAVNGGILFAEFEVPESVLPDWEAVYYWKHIIKNPSESLYIIYYPDTLTFIFLGSFM